MIVILYSRCEQRGRKISLTNSKKSAPTLTTAFYWLTDLFGLLSTFKATLCWPIHSSDNRAHIITSWKPVGGFGVIPNCCNQTRPFMCSLWELNLLLMRHTNSIQKPHTVSLYVRQMSHSWPPGRSWWWLVLYHLQEAAASDDTLQTDRQTTERLKLLKSCQEDCFLSPAEMKSTAAARETLFTAWHKQ